MGDDDEGLVFDEINLQKERSHLTVTISNGICVLWTPSGDESIILCQKILFEGKPDVREGVPILLPTYAPCESGPFHKFVKSNSWEIKEGFNPNSDSITFIQQENDEIRNTWNYKFKIEFTILLLNETQLKCDMVITNTGSEKFSFSCSLYSHFTVTDVAEDKVYGLNGCTYSQKDRDGNILEGTSLQPVEEEKITLSDLSQRIYLNTPSGQTIEKLPSNRSVKFEKFNLPDIALYNPYEEALNRLDGERIEEVADDYRKEITLETGTVASLVALEPNKSYTAHLILTLE